MTHIYIGNACVIIGAVLDVGILQPFRSTVGLSPKTHGLPPAPPPPPPAMVSTVDTLPLSDHASVGLRVS